MKYILLLITLLPLSSFAQGKWYLPNGKELPKDSIGNGSIIAVKEYSGSKYLASNETYDIIYRPLVRIALAVYAKNKSTARKKIEEFNEKTYTKDAFEKDYQAMNLHISKESVIKCLGIPEKDEPNKYYQGSTLFYNKGGVELYFSNNILAGYVYHKE